MNIPFVISSCKRSLFNSRPVHRKSFGAVATVAEDEAVFGTTIGSRIGCSASCGNLESCSQLGNVIEVHLSTITPCGNNILRLWHSSQSIHSSIMWQGVVFKNGIQVYIVIIVRVRVTVVIIFVVFITQNILFVCILWQLAQIAQLENRNLIACRIISLSTNHSLQGMRITLPVLTKAVPQQVERETGPLWTECVIHFVGAGVDFQFEIFFAIGPVSHQWMPRLYDFDVFIATSTWLFFFVVHVFIFAFFVVDRFIIFFNDFIHKRILKS
mmetsp:Transcript_26290/g.46709  ORF Transcript_26290/g.46709 Transcript_26290/m.46709 type:complete len:270 (+) Transcript_26290:1046-1855(+)